MSAKIRMADALLRSVGGRTVLLRIPAPAFAGDDGEQTGLALPTFQDSELKPVVFCKQRSTVNADGVTCELLVSASAVKALVGSLAYDSASVLFGSAAGVLVDGVLYTITSAVSAEAFEEVYLYRLGLRAPANGLV